MIGDSLMSIFKKKQETKVEPESAAKVIESERQRELGRRKWCVEMARDTETGSIVSAAKDIYNWVYEYERE